MWLFQSVGMSEKESISSETSNPGTGKVAAEFLEELSGKVQYIVADPAPKSSKWKKKKHAAAKGNNVDKIRHDNIKSNQEISCVELVSTKLDGLQESNTKVLEAMLESNKLAAEANKIAKQALLINAREQLWKRLHNRCYEYVELLHNSYVNEARQAITLFMQSNGKYLDQKQPDEAQFRNGNRCNSIASKKQIDLAKSYINTLLTEAMGKPPVWKIKNERHAVYYD
jgi:hypothetical protein